MTVFWLVVGTLVIVWLIHQFKRCMIQKLEQDADPPKRRSVLIVDDDHDFAQSLFLMLCEDYEAVVAHTSREAIDIVRRGKVDLALLDLKLGNESGIDLMREIKKIQPDILCVMITGYGNGRTETESFESGAATYLVKPVAHRKLFEVIHSAIG